MAIWTVSQSGTANSTNGAMIHSGSGLIDIDGIEVHSNKLSFPLMIGGGSTFAIKGGFFDIDEDAGSSPAARTFAPAATVTKTGSSLSKGANESDEKILGGSGAAIVNITLSTGFKLEDYYVQLNKLKYPFSYKPVGSSSSTTLTITPVGESEIASE